jgi:hypothetical protein
VAFYPSEPGNAQATKQPTMKQKRNKNERRKSEDAKYFQGVKKRLAQLDLAECIALAKDITTWAREEGSHASYMSASVVEHDFGISERDVLALADIGALKGRDDIFKDGELYFEAKDIRAFFEGIAARKTRTSTKTDGEKSDNPITQKAA